MPCDFKKSLLSFVKLKTVIVSITAILLFVSNGWNHEIQNMNANYNSFAIHAMNFIVHVFPILVLIIIRVNWS